MFSRTHACSSQIKELLINNGLSNTRNALRSALAIAELTNRTLILPQFWSRHLQGEPYRVGVDYYFDWGLRRRSSNPGGAASPAQCAHTAQIQTIFGLARAAPLQSPARRETRRAGSGAARRRAAPPRAAETRRDPRPHCARVQTQKQLSAKEVLKPLRTSSRLVTLSSAKA